jgi:hypothetical protein
VRTSLTIDQGSQVGFFNPLSIIAVEDTAKDFAYFRWFINATLYEQDNSGHQVNMKALFSVMRLRNDWHPKVTICTQKELVSICITGDRRLGPSWEDVKWSEQDSSIQIKLPQGFMLNAQLQEMQYKQLQNMYNTAFAVQTSLFPMENRDFVEENIHEVGLEEFQYTDNVQSAFPLERVRRCRLRVFLRTHIAPDSYGSRCHYRGLRVLVAASPKNRVLAHAEHELTPRAPAFIEMSNEQNSDGNVNPAMTIFFSEKGRKSSFFMVFKDGKERSEAFNALTQLQAASDETEFANVRLKRLGIETTSDPDLFPKAAQNPLGRMQWDRALVINSDPRNPDDDFGQTLASANLRILAQGTGGTIVDRVNVGPGELKLRIAHDGTPTCTVLRHQQDDFMMTFDRNKMPFTADQVEELSKMVAVQATKRTFQFFNAVDLHSFQYAITGYRVKYDGLTRDFTITRRRAVALSKNKRLEAGLTRVQIVSYDNDSVVQVLAFFDDQVFTHADAMGFVVKGVDSYELYDGKPAGTKAKCGVRLSDAKFFLSKGKDRDKDRIEDVGKGFLCLDLPEPPAENDDIYIGFDEVEGTYSLQLKVNG